MYKLSLKLNGKVYESSDSDLEKAILDLKPEIFKTRGILTIKVGDKKVERFLMIPLLKRLFGVGGSRTQRIILDSQIKFIKRLLGEI